MNTLSHNLPEEVIEEILVRLPATSLVRLKRVSKSWKSLISDQRFINNHLQLHSHKPDVNLVLRWTRWFGTDKRRQQLANPQVVSLLTVEDTLDSGSSSSSSSGCSIREIFSIRPQWVSGAKGLPEALQFFHCNGIICLVDVDAHFSPRIAFFNPALRQSKLLVTPSFNPNFRFSGFGFGYDSKTGRYKFVRILTPDDESRVSKAQVFTLGINSWRVIQLDMNCAPCRDKGAYLNGFYYWLYREDACDRILSFDMSEDKFTSFTAPDIQDWQRRTDILVHGESLVYFHFPAKGIFETWVMDYNDKEDVVWNKYQKIAGRGIGRPLSFWKYNELLMEAKHGRIMSYHLGTKRFSTVSIDEGRMWCSTVARFYVEFNFSILSSKIS